VPPCINYRYIGYVLTVKAGGHFVCLCGAGLRTIPVEIEDTGTKYRTFLHRETLAFAQIFLLVRHRTPVSCGCFSHPGSKFKHYRPTPSPESSNGRFKRQSFFKYRTTQQYGQLSNAPFSSSTKNGFLSSSPSFISSSSGSP
jgi:hypothetical protein